MSTIQRDFQVLKLHHLAHVERLSFQLRLYFGHLDRLSLYTLNNKQQLSDKQIKTRRKRRKTFPPCQGLSKCAFRRIIASNRPLSHAKE